jgi:hypothetical protein
VPEIPDYVVAYAASIYHHTKADWPAVAGLLLGIGMGEHRPDDLAAQADAWTRAHFTPDAMALLERRARRPWRRPTIDTIELPRRKPKPLAPPARRGPHRR